MKERCGEREEDSENGGDGSQQEKEMREREEETMERNRQRKKEGKRSGSPALLALRWLKAKESARPRTRPGRDLLPSSFLHPALSPRTTRRCLASHGISLRSVHPLFFALQFSLVHFAIRKQLHHEGAATF